MKDRIRTRGEALRLDKKGNVKKPSPDEEQKLYEECVQSAATKDREKPLDQDDGGFADGVGGALGGIADGEATASRIADGEATASRIADGEATASRIADGEATASRIADGEATAYRIADGEALACLHFVYKMDKGL